MNFLDKNAHTHTHTDAHKSQSGAHTHTHTYRTQYIQGIYVRLTVKLRGDAEKYITNKSTPYNK